MTTTKEKIMYKSVLGIILFMGVVMAYNTYLRFYPFKTIVVSKVRVLTSEIKQGEEVKYEVDYCRFTDAPATVYRTVQSTRNPDDRYSLPITNSISVPGCHTLQRSIPIDPSIPPGEYYIKVVSIYEVNEYQKSKYEFTIGNFKIK